MRSIIKYRSITFYMMRQLTAVTVFVLLALTAAIWLTQSLRFVEMVVNRGLSFNSFVLLTMLLLPSFLSILLPISLFTAVLFTYNRLLTDSELIVMRAVGMAPLQLARPALLFTGVVVAVGYANSLYFLPLSQRTFVDLRNFVMNDLTSVFLTEGKFNNIQPGVTVYVRSREPSGELRGLIYHDNREREKPVTVMAERGTLALIEGKPRVIMFNGNRQMVERDSGRLSLLYFERYSVDLDRLQDQGSVWRKPQERYLHELLWLTDHPGDQVHANAMWAEAHNRIVSPLIGLGLALIALAAVLSGDFDRRGQTLRLIMAVAGAALFQGIAIGIQNFIIGEPYAAPLAYLNVLAACGLCLWWLLVGPRHRSRVAPAAA